MWRRSWKMEEALNTFQQWIFSSDTTSLTFGFLISSCPSECIPFSGVKNIFLTFWISSNNCSIFLGISLAGFCHTIMDCWNFSMKWSLDQERQTTLLSKWVNTEHSKCNNEIMKLVFRTLAFPPSISKQPLNSIMIRLRSTLFGCALQKLLTPAPFTRSRTMIWSTLTLEFMEFVRRRAMKRSRHSESWRSLQETTMGTR